MTCRPRGGYSGVGTAFADTDYAAIARAMGCRGVRCTKPDEIAPALRQGLSSGEPTVVDVVTSFKPTFRDVTSPLASG
jgi:acetolactate synthase-1/2/3 large subunit